MSRPSLQKDVKEEVAEGKTFLTTCRIETRTEMESAEEARLSQVLPWLYLGSQEAAGDEELLRHHRISHSLNLGSSSSREQWTWHVVERSLELQDSPEQRIDGAVAEGTRFLQECKARGGRVLVHCSAGESRSPTLVIAFLISTRGCSFLEAFSLVKERRPSINPNPSFVAQLKQIVCR